MRIGKHDGASERYIFRHELCCDIVKSLNVDRFNSKLLEIRCELSICDALGLSIVVIVARAVIVAIIESALFSKPVFFVAAFVVSPCFNQHDGQSFRLALSIDELFGREITFKYSGVIFIQLRVAIRQQHSSVDIQFSSIF